MCQTVRTFILLIILVIICTYVFLNLIYTYILSTRKINYSVQVLKPLKKIDVINVTSSFVLGGRHFIVQ